VFRIELVEILPKNIRGRASRGTEAKRAYSTHNRATKDEKEKGMTHKVIVSKLQ
jgi:hypothetical protein